MKNKKDIFANACIAIGVLCIIAAGVWAIYNELENRRSEKNDQEVVEKIREITGPELDNENETISENSLLEMPVKIIDGYGYIGYLSFPSLDSEFPVMAEWDYKRLKKAPCRYFGSVYSDDLVVAGHNYRSGFGKLRNLKEGDSVKFTTMDDHVFFYEVATVEVLEPTDIEDMIDSPFDLSLYTCTYGGKQRITVRCIRSE